MTKEIAIDPHGDLILQVGSEDSQRSMRVSSKVLSVASKVFRAMFSRRFREGTLLAQSSDANPFELPLPDDDPGAMTILCRLLHHQNEDLPTDETINLNTLYAFSAVVDKYECMTAAKYAADHWLRALCNYDIPTKGQGHKLMISSYRLNDARAFQKASRWVSFNCDADDISKLRVEDDALDESIYDLLDERRKCMQQSLFNGLLEPINELLDGDGIQDHTDIHEKASDEEDDKYPWDHESVDSHTLANPICVHSSHKASGYIMQLMELQLWPKLHSGASISSSLSKLSSFKERDIMYGFGYDAHRSKNCRACRMDLRERIQGVVKKFKDEYQGLCLYCAREGNNKDRICRIRHKSLRNSFSLSPF